MSATMTRFPIDYDRIIAPSRRIAPRGGLRTRLGRFRRRFLPGIARAQSAREDLARGLEIMARRARGPLEAAMFRAWAEGVRRG